jgi:two-component system chemotaxis response regulator CheY
MIVDDSLHSRLILRDLLMSHGFSVVGEASNGGQAIELYEQINPDLVMVDARMPDMDGVCAIREILHRNPEALTIVCAGSGEKTSVVEAMSAGAVDFCAKPYVPRRVVSTLRRALAGVASQH